MRRPLRGPAILGEQQKLRFLVGDACFLQLVFPLEIANRRLRVRAVLTVNAARQVVFAHQPRLKPANVAALRAILQVAHVGGQLLPQEVEYALRRNFFTRFLGFVGERQEHKPRLLRRDRASLRGNQRVQRLKRRRFHRGQRFAQRRLTLRLRARLHRLNIRPRERHAAFRLRAVHAVRAAVHEAQPDQKRLQLLHLVALRADFQFLGFRKGSLRLRPASFLFCSIRRFRLLGQPFPLGVRRRKQKAAERPALSILNGHVSAAGQKQRQKQDQRNESFFHIRVTPVFLIHAV